MRSVSVDNFLFYVSTALNEETKFSTEKSPSPR